MEKNYVEMSFKERKRLFITFLKKDGCFSAYKENIFKHKKTFSSILECSNPIAGAFIWSRTKQGHIFWEKVAIRWGKYLSNE